jgi:hypothetical protein
LAIVAAASAAALFAGTTSISLESVSALFAGTLPTVAVSARLFLFAME